MCPKGDDPLTAFADYRSIVITVNQYASTPLSGNYKFVFNGQPLSLPTSQWENVECEKAFKSLPNVGSVSCTVSRNGRFGGYIILVKFLNFPVLPFENNIFQNDGYPSIIRFNCDSTGVLSTGSVSCSISEVPSVSVPGNKTLILP
jgi:hypothetical protein